MTAFAGLARVRQTAAVSPKVKASLLAFMLFLQIVACYMRVLLPDRGLFTADPPESKEISQQFFRAVTGAGSAHAGPVQSRSRKLRRVRHGWLAFVYRLLPALDVPGAVEAGRALVTGDPASRRRAA